MSLPPPHVVAIEGTSNPLTPLIRRLEAATSRLEDIASSAGPLNDSNALGAEQNGIPATRAISGGRSGSHPAPPGMVVGGPGVAPGLAKSPPPAATPAKLELPPALQEMDSLIDTEVAAFVDAGKGLDNLLEEQTTAVAKAFRDQRKFLLVSTKAKKPDMTSATFPELLEDLQHDMGTVGDIRDSNRASPVKEHLAMVGEGISALQWLLMDGKPADYIGEVLGGAQMYGNRVLKAFKESDQKHVKYVQSYYALLKSLKAYVLKNYPSGVTWNNNGIDAVQAYREADGAPTTNGAPGPASSNGGPPPPPPLPNFDNVPAPPPPPPGAAPANKAAAGGDMDAVFQSLNRGSDVTKGLKRVDQSQMTHKNPSLRAAGVVSERRDSEDSITRSRSRGPETKPKPAGMRQNSTNTVISKKEGKKELDGNKWIISDFEGPPAPIEIEVSLTQSLLISNCTKTTIVLRGKANAISIDNSPRLQLLVETLVSSIDVIKSPNFAVQITGTLPTIMLDQVDGATIYLGESSLATEVFTSKCSSINVVLPAQSGEDDKELPLPEQIRTFVRGGKLVSEIVEHAG
ncbi:suppressor of rasval19 [Oleoguttula sp. CCFEE 5521]